MTSTTGSTSTPAHPSEPRRRLARRLGTLTLLAGLLLVPAGIGTSVMISSQLRGEGIELHEDAPLFAGTTVDGPVDAFLQAEVIRGHAAEIADGKTYAGLDRDDPVRATVMETAFLRASLFTSVIAFGVAALVTGLGLLFVAVGTALRALTAPAPATAPATVTVTEPAVATAPA